MAQRLTHIFRPGDGTREAGKHWFESRTKPSFLMLAKEEERPFCVFFGTMRLFSERKAEKVFQICFFLVPS